jgi:hypothetical protein
MILWITLESAAVRRKLSVWERWHVPIIPATWEAEIRGLKTKADPKQKT